MPLTLELPSEIKARLQAEAQARHVSLESLATEMLTQGAILVALNLTDQERESAHHIWDLLGRVESDDSEGLQAFQEAPASVRAAITSAAQLDRTGNAPEKNPFASRQQNASYLSRLEL